MSTKVLCIYMAKHGKHILENLQILKLLVLSLTRPFPCKLQPAGELQGIMLKIYCERCWLISEDIEIIFFEKLMCGYAVVLSVSVMMLVLHMQF